MVDMNEKEMIDKLIDKYTDLQRIEKSDNPQKEVHANGVSQRSLLRSKTAELRRPAVA